MADLTDKIEGNEIDLVCLLLYKDCKRFIVIFSSDIFENNLLKCDNYKQKC